MIEEIEETAEADTSEDLPATEETRPSPEITRTPPSKGTTLGRADSYRQPEPTHPSRAYAPVREAFRGVRRRNARNAETRDVTPDVAASHSH